jgi:hypothetical protein
VGTNEGYGRWVGSHPFFSGPFLWRWEYGQETRLPMDGGEVAMCVLSLEGGRRLSSLL